MIRVLIVDDQRTVRKILEEALSHDPEIEIVGKASNALEAKRLVPNLKPDIITLDVEMPGMNGLEFLDWLMQSYPTPAIMLSSYTEKGAEITLEALQKGAMDFVEKPDGTEEDFLRMLDELSYKIKKLGKIQSYKSKKTIEKISKDEQAKIHTTERKGHLKLIAIGASTGGTQALDFILSSLPNNFPPIVVVQHMPEHFTKLFANRLNETTGLQVKEAENGDILEDGGVYIAPGNKHMLIRKLAGKFLIEIEVFDKVSGHRPSIDVLFESIAKSSFAASVLAILLTGMGRDGANGLLSLRESGSKTIGQNEATSAVYGMPKEAFLLGAVEKQVGLESIPREILAII